MFSLDGAILHELSSYRPENPLDSGKNETWW